MSKVLLLYLFLPIPKRLLKLVFHFARIVPKRIGEHAQIEKRFINPRTSGCIRVSK